MKRLAWLRRAPLLALFVLAAGCSGPLVGPMAGAEASSGSMMPTRQIVVVLGGAQRAQWDRIESALVAEHPVRLVDRFPLVSIDVRCLIFEIPGERSMDAVVARLRADPRVEDAQPNRTFTSLTGPDPYADLQWGRKAVAADRISPRPTGKGVKVAIVDTGADTRHPDLRSRIERTVNLVDTKGDTQGESFDADQHGTAVAGVIAASANNNVGIAGVAPEADLMIVKACRQASADRAKAMCMSWTIARAIDLAILARVRIINLSLAGPPDALVARLIRKAHERRIIVIASADADQKSFPATMAEVIGVLASDVSGRVAPPAWRGESALIAAPGVEVLTTVPGGSYDYKSGSSLSSAHIAGMVALLLDAHPDCSVQDIRDALFASAAARVETGDSGARLVGVPDARAALRQLR